MKKSARKRVRHKRLKRKQRDQRIDLRIMRGIFFGALTGISPVGENPSSEDDYQLMREEVNKLSGVDTTLIAQLLEKQLTQQCKDVRNDLSLSKANHGSYIQAKLKFKHTIWFLAFMLVLIQGIYISLADGPFLQSAFDSLVNNKVLFYLHAAIQTTVGVPIIGMIFYSIYFGYVKTSCTLAENVFRAFGWKNPKGIDLEALTINREKELKRSGE